MDRKKRIGIYFTAGANWLGGVYYLVNLVNSCSYLPKEEQDRWGFTIFYNDESERFIKLFTYHDVAFVKLSSIDARKAFAKSIVLRKNLFLPQEVSATRVVGLYPFNDFPVKTKTDIKLVSWYPDLQHRFYPEYFQKFKLWQRELRLQKLLKHSEHLVMSSQDVASHFSRFYPDAQIEKTVLPFVSLTDTDEIVDKAVVTKRYGLQADYFMVSNQFYKHKDHKTLLEALAEVKKQKPDVVVAMTGKMEDYRDPTYITSLKKIIADHDLTENVYLLGVIPRGDQLSLMKHAIAVIQPSLFEGWSTVVEDVKSIAGRIIASDIAIHKEQLGDEGVLFGQSDPVHLSQQMLSVADNPASAETAFSYRDNIIRFATSFLAIFENTDRESK